MRSGQLIYAEGRDLIVVAPVHSGAQLLADGNIHVYGPLKGRAVAGTRGARDSQVFCLTLEAELVGVDTGYVTSDDIPPAVWGGPARVCPDARRGSAPSSRWRWENAPRPRWRTRRAGSSDGVRSGQKARLTSICE